MRFTNRAQTPPLARPDSCEGVSRDASRMRFQEIDTQNSADPRRLVFPDYSQTSAGSVVQIRDLWGEKEHLHTELVRRDETVTELEFE